MSSSKKEELNNLYAAFKRKAQEIINGYDIDESSPKAKYLKKQEIPFCDLLIEQEQQQQLSVSKVQGSFCDFNNSNLKLSEKLSVWSGSYQITSEAMNDLYGIFKNYGISLDSTTIIPNSIVKKTTDQHQSTDSHSDNSINERIKSEFLDDSFNDDNNTNEVTLGAVMMKINSLISIVNSTNLDVQCIKRSLSRFEEPPIPIEMKSFIEDSVELIPGMELPVRTKEDLLKLENQLYNAETSKRIANRIKFEVVDLKRSLYCNFSSIGEKLICHALAAEYSLCGQRGKARFLDFRNIVAFMKYTCRLGYESRGHLFTFSEIEQEKAIGSFLRYIKSRPGD